MVRILQFSLFLALLDFFLVGLCRSFSHTWVWLGLLLCMAIQAMTRSICVTLGVILLNNVVVYANTLGFVNGFSQCKLLLFFFRKGLLFYDINTFLGCFSFFSLKKRLYFCCKNSKSSVVRSFMVKVKKRKE
jgi:hypothetical protein